MPLLDELRPVRAGAREHDFADDSSGHLQEVRAIPASPQTRPSAERLQAHHGDLPGLQGPHHAEATRLHARKTPAFLARKILCPPNILNLVNFQDK